MTIADGKVEARIEDDAYDRDPSLRQKLHSALNDRFLGVQLLSHQTYSLSNSSMVRASADGVRGVFIEVPAARLVWTGFAPDILVRDKDGNAVIDTRRERIDKKRTLAELVEKHRSKDVLLDALLSSYQASVKDPDNELVHLYEIREALSKRFGRLADAIRRVIGNEWSRLGKLANDEPLRQG
jgi:hypothetical protein